MRWMRAATWMILLMAVPLMAPGQGEDRGQAREQFAAHQAELGRAELIGTHFLRGNMAGIAPFISTTLARQWSAEELERRREFFLEAGGEPRHVQAAYFLPRGAADTVRRAVVPLDFERGGVDLVLGWVGTLSEAALVSLEFRRQTARPAVALPIPPPENRPPAYSDPLYVLAETISERDVALAEVDGRRPLARLTMPRDRLPLNGAPAVLLLADRLQSDIDGSTAPDSKPLREIARGLATQGIAVLRVIRRHPANAEGVVYTLYDDQVLDATDALSRLAQVPGVDRTQLYVAGWQTGSLAATQVAIRARAVRGVILLDPVSNWSLEEEVARLTALGAPIDGDALRGHATQLRRGLTPPALLCIDAPAAYWADLVARDFTVDMAAIAQPGIIMVPESGGLSTGINRDFLAGWAGASRTRVVYTIPGTRSAMRPTGEGVVAPEAVRLMADWIWAEWRASRPQAGARR